MEKQVLEAEKRRLWNAQTELKEKIDAAGGVAAYIGSLDARTRTGLFRRENDAVGCMDEGCIGCGLRIAGSGILIEEADLPSFLENCRKLGADSFTHHDNCGAAGVYAKKIKSAEEPEKLAEKFSDSAAAGLGVPHGHIPAAEMSRPKEFHATRFAYYDGTGRLNLKNAEGILPNGFVLTRALYPKEQYAAAEAELSFQIASGQHGFGELITADEPFEMIVIGDADNSAMSLEKLTAELASLRGNPRIRITGFAAPPVSRLSLEAEPRGCASRNRSGAIRGDFC
jgi:hypothetical protein